MAQDKRVLVRASRGGVSSFLTILSTFIPYGELLCVLACVVSFIGLDIIIQTSHESAMVSLKLKEWTKAENDATSALQIDPSHVKSYQRRSRARLALGKLRAALRDLNLAAEQISNIYSADTDADEAAADAEGPGTRARAHAHHVRQIEIQRRGVERELRASVRRAPKRNVPIIRNDVTVYDEGVSASGGGADGNASELKISEEPGGISPGTPIAKESTAIVAAEGGDEDPTAAFGGRYLASVVGTAITSATSSSPTPGALESDAMNKSPKPESRNETKENSDDFEVPVVGGCCADKSGKNNESKGKPKRPSSFTDIKNLKKPKTWYEFEAAWKGLRSESERIRYLVNSVKPRQLSKLYSRNGGIEDVDVLVDLIVTSSGMIDDDGRGGGRDASGSATAVLYLRAIANLPSVDLPVMMMSKEQRGKVRDAIKRGCYLLGGESKDVNDDASDIASKLGGY